MRCEGITSCWSTYNGMNGSSQPTARWATAVRNSNAELPPGEQTVLPPTVPCFFLFSLFLRWSGTGPELSEILQRGGAPAQCLAVSCWVCWVLEAHRGPWCAPLYSSAVMAQFVVIYRNKICTRQCHLKIVDGTVRTLLSNRIIREASAPRGLGGADVRDSVGYRGRLRKHKG